MTSTNLPFVTLPDPAVAGEGVLDPLGLSVIGDRLADQILPGLRARMSRPRFITAIAVASAVCEGIEDRIAEDGITPAYLVFEWVLVEAFVRAGDPEKTTGTPGTLKAQRAKASRMPLSAKTYLRVPGIFGFHGVYKPLARHLGVIDDEMRLGDNGYGLLKVWQEEQDLPGFLESSFGKGSGASLRQLLRSAVDDGLRRGHTDRGGGWQGWNLLAKYLVPGSIGRREGEFLRRMFLDHAGGTRGEVFRLLENDAASEAPESVLVRDVLAPRASDELRQKLKAVSAYESVATLLEDGFDWIRFLSASAGARALSSTDYRNQKETGRIARQLQVALAGAEDALAAAPLSLQQQFGGLVKAFGSVRDEFELFDSLLNHHSGIQKAKKPDGKRDWFERGKAGAAFVRVPYRLTKPPAPREWWSRPYRISTTQSFLRDLPVGG